MATVSVIILARNEEHNIHDCIESVQFADEVLVIDDFSTDNTVKIAEEMGASVVQHAMNGDWGAQQTFGIEQAKSDWILFLDADERISEPLAKEIQAIVVNEPNNGAINSIITTLHMVYCVQTMCFASCQKRVAM